MKGWLNLSHTKTNGRIACIGQGMLIAVAIIITPRYSRWASGAADTKARR